MPYQIHNKVEGNQVDQDYWPNTNLILGILWKYHYLEI